MLSRLVRQFLFILVHLVVNILVAVQNVYYRFYDKKYILQKDEVIKSDIKVILEHVPKFTKKLRHLVVLTDRDQHTYSELARMVIWSLVTGISHLSFYDISGNLKENEEQLFLEVEKKKKGVPGCIKWLRKPNLNGYTNGLQAHTIVINIFTHADGLPRIAHCIQQIAEDKVICSSKCNDFTAQDLDDVVKLMYPSIPDPDLVLYSGPWCCTHGLLPWHIRLTEFVQLSLGNSVNIDSYISALYRYNKCDQRFGK